MVAKQRKENDLSLKKKSYNGIYLRRGENLKNRFTGL